MVILIFSTIIGFSLAIIIPMIIVVSLAIVFLIAWTLFFIVTRLLLGEEKMVFCPHCGEKTNVNQSSVQIYNNEPTIWRRRQCHNKECRNGDLYHTIEIPKPKDMKVEYQ